MNKQILTAPLALILLLGCAGPRQEAQPSVAHKALTTEKLS